MSPENNAEKIQSSKELREHLLKDPYRPGYHFAVPEDVGKPGDPNGAFYANGRYHLMYLYNRRGMRQWSGSGFCWGHISSHDLVHWRHHPDALIPGDGDSGCYSGGGFVDDDGTAYITFWRLPLKKGDPAGTGIGIARSSDRHFDKWEKLQVPTLDGTEWGIRQIATPMCNADPSNIWKKDGFYYMQAGNLLVLNKFGREQDSPAKFRGDWVDIFRSSDLITWEYLHRFYDRNPSNRWTQESEDDMCPSFLPLPLSRDGGEMSDKYLQLFISHNMGCQYYIGTYARGKDKFMPENHGRMTWVDNTFFAPEALIDQKGRQIMWAWLTDNPYGELSDVLRAGWSGVYGLPRVLWLGDNNTLCLAPVPEVNILRYNFRQFEACTVKDGAETILENINGKSCEIKLTVDPRAAKTAGVRVRTSPDNEETTLLYYDAEREKLVLDSTASGKLGRKVLESAPLQLSEGEQLELDIFIDNSVIEVFANDRQAITRRVYPERLDSDQVRLFCNGGPRTGDPRTGDPRNGGEATFSKIESWEMMPSNSC